eukprot:13972201-Alexandrium_andersonii.AAC.1
MMRPVHDGMLRLFVANCRFGNSAHSDSTATSVLMDLLSAALQFLTGVAPLTCNEWMGIKH